MDGNFGAEAKVREALDTMAVRENPDIRKRLQKQKESLLGEVEKIDSALKFLDENPNFEQFHNLMQKIRY